MLFDSLLRRSGKMISCLTASALLLSGQTLSVSAATPTETFQKRLLSAWDKLSGSVFISDLNLSETDVQDAFYNLLYTHPERFYVTSGYKFTSFRNTVFEVQLQYNYDKKDIPTMIPKYDAAVQKIVDGCGDDWSDAQKLLYFHDYLAGTYEYDDSSTHYEPYSLLIEGSAVCQGYSLAMCSLCQAVDIPCYCVASKERGHMWNVVQVDGEWYHLDATFDDPSPDILGQCAHNYLLLSNSAMSKDNYHSAKDWVIYTNGDTVTFQSEKYDDAFWKISIDAAEVLPDGTMLMNLQTDSSTIQSASQIGVQALKIYGQPNGSFSTSSILSFNTFWRSTDNQIYANCYSYCDYYQGKIFFTSQNQIFVANADGSDKQIFYSLTPEEQQDGKIYGLRISDTGLLEYQVQWAPTYMDDSGNLPHTIHSIQLDNTLFPPQTTTSTTPTTTTTSTTTSTSTTITSTTTSTTTTTTTTTTSTTSTTTTTTTTSTTTCTTTSSTTSSTTVTSTTTRTTTATSTTRNTTSATSSTTARNTTTVPVSTTKQVTKPLTTSITSTTAVTTTTTTKSVVKPTVYGDVNLDGKVKINDAVLLSRYNNEESAIRILSQGLVNADCNADAHLDAGDVAIILKIIVRLIEL